MSSVHRTRVTILGSGWGAVQLLKNLNPNKFAISVVSPRNHMLFTPLLPSASVGTLNPRSICEPLRPLCASLGARYYEASAETILTQDRIVNCRSLRGDAFQVSFDRCVIAVGYRANDFNLPGVKENALFMKETRDATRFREHLLTRLEDASYAHALGGCPEARIKQLCSIVVVGGGPTGVELAAEITDFVRNDVRKLYPHLFKYISVHLVEGMKGVLNHLQDQTLKTYALEHLTRNQGVEMHLQEFVSEATDAELRLKSGKVIPYGTLVWCAGVKPVPVIKQLDLAKTPNGGQLLTEPTMHVKGQKKIFAIGDCAQIEDQRLPQTAQVAKQQAQYLAKELNAGDRFIKPFVFKSLGSMAYLGSNKALIADSPVIKKMRGFLAWMGWRSAYWGMQLTMRNRVSIGLDWINTSMFGRPMVRFGQCTVESDPRLQVPDVARGIRARVDEACAAEAWAGAPDSKPSLEIGAQALAAAAKQDRAQANAQA